SAPEFTVHRGRRGSTAARFLRPALGRPNLSVEVGALTTRVILQQGRAVGIEYEQGGVQHVAQATREVILSGGAFNSPQLLLLSGIGPGEELRDNGIEVHCDLPGVGRNLQDHASVASLYEASGPFTFDNQLRADRMARSIMRWQLFGTGPLAGLPVGAQGFIKTRPGLDRPDLQQLVSPVAMDAKVWFPGWRKGRGHYFSVANVLLHPESRGWVRLASPDPRAKPRIQFNLLSTAGDRASFRRFQRNLRTFFATEPARSMVSAELVPGPAVQSDDEIDAYVRRGVGTAMHPTSTCAMGTGTDAVLDAQLRVRGVDGLRVVDASSMPLIVGGNTNAPVIMIAEKAADMILGKPAPAAADYARAA
ncbi:MAG: GMC family oxidoreductase, partial [Janthinobacterium lividum]